MSVDEKPVWVEPEINSFSKIEYAIGWAQSFCGDFQEIGIKRLKNGEWAVEVLSFRKNIKHGLRNVTKG